MIRPLRTAHRWIWTLLAVLLPLLLWAALAARVDPPGDGLPADLAERASAGSSAAKAEPPGGGEGGPR